MFSLKLSSSEILQDDNEFKELTDEVDVEIKILQTLIWCNTIKEILKET